MANSSQTERSPSSVTIYFWRMTALVVILILYSWLAQLPMMEMLPFALMLLVASVPVTLSLWRPRLAPWNWLAAEYS